MMIYILFISLFVSSLFVTNISSAAEQRMLFNVESISFKKGTGEYSCKNSCTTLYNDPPLEKMLSEGWRIVSSSPKEAIGEDYYDRMDVPVRVPNTYYKKMSQNLPYQAKTKNCLKRKMNY